MTPGNFRVISAAVASMIFVLAGCSVAGSSAAAPPLVDANITIAAVPSADLASVYIAQDDGFFAKQGLHVTLDKVPSSQAIIADQLAGKIDLCAGAYTPYISAEAAGKRFRILAEGSIMTTGTRLLLVPKGSSLTRNEPARGQDDRDERDQQHRHPARQGGAGAERRQPG